MDVNHTKEWGSFTNEIRVEAGSMFRIIGICVYIFYDGVTGSLGNYQGFYLNGGWKMVWKKCDRHIFTVLHTVHCDVT